MSDLVDDSLISRMNKFQCLVENRATCRTVADAYLPPASQVDPTEGEIVEATEGFRAVLYDDSTSEPVSDEPVKVEATESGCIYLFETCLGF